MNGGSPRVALAGFLHESNTFLPVPSPVNDFRTTSWTEGADIFTRWSGALHEVGGLIDGCAAAGLSIEPLLVTYAVPSGTIVAEAFEEIASGITDSLRAAMPVDGVLLALHGATVSEQHRDADGEIIRRVRAIAGDKVPIIVTLDLHANISRLMVDESNAIICYRTNPHLDQRERGLEAASLMARTLRGEVWPVQAMETPPWIIPIDRQYTSQFPAKQLYDDIGEVMKDPRILSASVAMAFTSPMCGRWERRSWRWRMATPRSQGAPRRVWRSVPGRGGISFAQAWYPLKKRSAGLHRATNVRWVCLTWATTWAEARQRTRRFCFRRSSGKAFRTAWPYFTIPKASLPVLPPVCGTRSGFRLAQRRTPCMACPYSWKASCELLRTGGLSSANAVTADGARTIRA